MLAPKHCEACRSVGMIHCHDPANCGGPWSDCARDGSPKGGGEDATPKAQQPGGEATRPDIPAGWCLIPLEPTHKMVSEGLFAEDGTYTHNGRMRAVYRAMLSARPGTGGE
jgi:hypothetical protein